MFYNNYEGGFVPHSLLKKFERCKNMLSFLNASVIWLLQVIMKAIFLIIPKYGWRKLIEVVFFFKNNITFQLFVSLETIARQILPAHLTSPGNSL